MRREVGSTRVMAAIESAIGVINAVAIARSSPRLIGIALAAFDYVMDMQTERGDGTELFYARCAVLHAPAPPASTPLTWCGQTLTTKPGSCAKSI
jgi:citrate lyase beta subunit